MKHREQNRRHSGFPQTLTPLALAVSLAGLTLSLPAHAVSFSFMNDEVKGSLDTTLTYGSLWRVTAPDRENIAIANGGTRASANYDNGTQNYERGEQVSSLFRMTNDLELSYKNFGAFTRILSFYDSAIQSKGLGAQRGDERVLKNRLGHDYEIYDAYVRGTFNVADRSLNARIGRQVVNWGESTFIPNGINVINPVDVARLRAPGSELRDAFLPVNMLWVSQELTDNLSVEAFNQFAHRKTRLEPNGSFFSTNDFASPGGSRVVPGSGVRPDDFPVFIPRTPDRDPRNKNQYGMALRYLAPALNNTEFGAYYVNYHSRTPLISGTTAPASATASPATVSQAAYFNEYPENIRLFGLSFNTLGPGGIAFQGEYSYRPNQPLQLSATDLLAELVTKGGANSLANPGIAPGSSSTDASGFKRVKMHQVQVTATQTFGPQLKANQLVGVLEAGYTYYDLPNNFAFNAVGVDFGSNGVAGVPGPTSAQVLGTTPQPGGYVTRNSYGYRMVLRADYLSALGPVNVSPRIAWSHDLRGTGQTFVQGVKAVSVGTNFNYQQNWQADISYTNFFGGEFFNGLTGGNAATATPPTIPARGSNNLLSDRDFVAATVSYSF